MGRAGSGATSDDSGAARRDDFDRDIATIAAIALFVGMRLWRLTDFALDGDEIFSVVLAHNNWHYLFAHAVEDAIHPPLLYVL